MTDETKNDETLAGTPKEAPEAAPDVKMEKSKEKKPKKKRGVGRVIRKIIALILVFLLGFLSCVGAIAGAGYYAYKNISLDKLEEMGVVNVDTSTLIGDGADVSLTAMTIESMIAEIQSLSSLGDRVTLSFLIERYKLTLPEDVNAYIPDGLRDLPLQKLTTEEGIKMLLENTNMDYVLGLLPEGILSEPAQAQLRDKTLQDVVDMNLGYLLDGVCLGYLTGVEYVLENGVYTVVYADPEAPTLLEMFAPADLGKLIHALGEGEDLMVALCADVGDVAVESLMETFIDLDSFIFPGMFSDKTFSDLIATDPETGKQYFDFGRLLNGRTFGEMLAYTPVYDANGHTVGWNDKNGTPVRGFMRGFASADLSALGENGGDLSSLIEELYLGDILNYTPVFDGDGNVVSFLDASGNAPASPYDTLSMYLVSDLTDGSFDISDLIDGDTQVGTLLGYSYREDGDKWFDGDGNELTGIAASFVGLTMDELSDSDNVMDHFGDMQVGALLGYSYREDGDKWFDGNGNELSLVAASFVDLTVDELTDSESITDRFGDMQVGALLGYSYREDGDKWFDGSGSEISGIVSSFVDLMVDEFSDQDVIIDRFGDVLVGDAIGLTFSDGYWTDGEKRVSGIVKSIADKKVGVLYDEMQTMSLGDIMGYTKENGTWLDENGVCVTGIALAFADLAIDRLNDTDELIDKLGGVTVGDAVDFDLVNGEWLDGGAPVTGIMKVLANKTIGELDENTLNEITIADAMDYTNVNGVWMSGSGKVTGVMRVLADKTIGSLDRAVDEIKIGDIMDYVYDETAGVWKNANGNAMQGVMTSFADLSIIDFTNEDLLLEQIRTVRLGDALGYQQINGTWYNGVRPVSAFMAILAGETLADVESTVNETEIGHLLGYKKVGNKWYDGTLAQTALVSTICNATLDTLADELDILTLSDVVAAEDRETGVFSLIDGATLLSDLSAEMTRVFETTTMERLTEGDDPIIYIAPPTMTRLNVLVPDWKGKTLSKFIQHLVESLPH